MPRGSTTEAAGHQRRHVSLEVKIAHLPEQPGVYLFKNRLGKVIYVGKAKNLRNRVRSYFGARPNSESPKVQAMVRQIHDLETMVTDSEVEALILEANLVKEYKPRYNINLKDDKSYPYVRVTAEPFPRVFPTRRVVQDGSRYFGPYTDVNALRDLLKTIRRIFPIRSCNYELTAETIAKGKFKVCLDYHINRCLGPCEGHVGQAEYGRVVDYVVQFIDGRSDAVADALRERMHELAAQLRFEEAARLRDILASLDDFRQKQKVVSQSPVDRDILATAVAGDDACGVVFRVREGKLVGRQHFYMSGTAGESLASVATSFLKQYYVKSEYVPAEVFVPCEMLEQEQIVGWLTRKRNGQVTLVCPTGGEELKLVRMCQRNAELLLNELQLQKASPQARVSRAVAALQHDLALPRPPRVIEAFDVSNISGSEPVASMVYFRNGKPVKSQYRRFRIRCENTPNDYAMMSEAVTRRYARLKQEGGELPDLILVDGGKGQLGVAQAALASLGLEVPVVALAKRLDEVFVPGASEPQNVPRSSSGLKLLQRIRDESHRFAVTYHRLLRDKRTLRSVLDAIPGVGKARRQALLKTFGSAEGVRQATAEQIAAVPGIPPALAERIWKALNEPPGEGEEA
ncbi:MAG: excinuclease ABC subunit UvrC [candidate division KSB1 bacterium]|nr:excinuclease ABC subunit UvrC [candidate division KSB1 bacterium]